jgi:hypothetical protein
MVACPCGEQWIRQRPRAWLWLPGEAECAQAREGVVDALGVGGDGVWSEPDADRSYDRLRVRMNTPEQVPLAGRQASVRVEVVEPAAAAMMRKTVG